jgi:peptidoglycan hydrolase-like protein with peptidoglycan-binding domain
LHATLGKGVKDVFGPTASKSDLKKAIYANGGDVAVKPTKKEAKEIIAKPPVAKRPAAPAEKPAEKAEVKPLVADSAKELTVEDWKKFQTILQRDHGYSGAVDGDPGKITWAAVQRSIASFGYAGAVDGVPGPNTYKGVQRRLVARAGYEGRIDGTWGPQSIAALRGAIQSNKY